MNGESEILNRILKELEGKADKSWVEARFQKQDEVIGTMFEAMKEGFEQVDQRFEKMDERFDKMDQRFDKMDERFDKMDARFDKMDARFIEQDLKMEQWRSDCRAFTEGWKQNQFRIELLESRVGDLETKSA